ncbi:PCYCGC domain-containing protein [Viridibacillus sp. YIM B01967]|uniref:PCYCGC domain-containing protein n=1 Tax=Viridibacillus soli TaxID=2798301 RepID=A0ABS1H5B3_9BACL|nr:PCYCGC motif-containing (lipo)protein [Viridibacillus soli]MBK3494608.1 PCYCGC domain-containing protein [Viridibacillus soli]
MKFRWFTLLLAGSMLLTACSSDQDKADEPVKQEQHKEEQAGHQHTVANGDIQETTASADDLPNFLDTQSDDLKLVYKATGQATEILQWIPCYCGCGESAGHKSNMNCFISEVKEDGSIVWDDHGTRCVACVEIAIQSIKMAQEGKTLKEIRQFIDETYKEGYAEPTPTPFPA